jgi:hypothetical protein
MWSRNSLGKPEKSVIKTASAGQANFDVSNQTLSLLSNAQCPTLHETHKKELAVAVPDAELTAIYERICI